MVADYRLVVLPTIQRLFTWCCGRTDESEEACADNEDFHLEWAVNERSKPPSIPRQPTAFWIGSTLRHMEHKSDGCIPATFLVGVDCASSPRTTTPTTTTTIGVVCGMRLWLLVVLAITRVPVAGQQEQAQRGNWKAPSIPILWPK